MTWKRSVLASIGWWVFCASALAKSPPVTFDGCYWIWSFPDPGQNSVSYPGGAWYFRAALAVAEKSPPPAAEMFVTADNLFTLYVNGKLVGQSYANPNWWHRPKRFDVSKFLLPGRNVIAVEAINTVPGPAGLLVKLVGRTAGGQPLACVSDAAWKSSDTEEKNWQRPAFDDKSWHAAYVVGDYGCAPWGRFARDLTKTPLENPWPAGQPPVNYQPMISNQAGQAGPPPSNVVETAPPADYPWPEAVVYLGDDCSLYRGTKPGTSHDSLGVTMFTARQSRSYPEHDLPSPLKMGRKLYLLQPARPGVQPRLILDAGRGAIGPPSVSFDGRWIYLAMARDDERFFHVYRLPAAGGSPRRLTDGPFHDIDPAELPDGRIAFTSTRIGTFEEYHSPPSRALFVMHADGGDVRPLSNTFIFDNEPRPMADGRILFIRSDNFFGRGKVETLLHAVHPDGTEGYTEFGLDNGPEYGGRLRAFYCGSPAPMPDGRVAFVSASGLTIARPGAAARHWQNLQVAAGDVTALPDGRLLSAIARSTPHATGAGKKKRVVYDFSYEKISILDPRMKPVTQTLLYDSHGAALHSPVYLGPRPRPPVLARTIDAGGENNVAATGFFFCQNARFTRNTAAGWSHVRAIRVLGGKGLTKRSSHSYIVHAGAEVTELGTVPLAPDGSFYIEVPADRAIAFQAVDAEGRSELNEMSWIYVRPGEQRSCLGCHQPRQTAPACTAPAGLALRARPLKLLGRGQPHRFRGNNAAVTGLMEMQADRFREVAGINQHSETSDPLFTSGQEVAALVAQLQSGDEGLRISAAQRLAIFRNRAAAAALAQRLGDESYEVRVAAAMALAACGTRESLPPLLAALADRQPLVAQAAAVALENLTGHTEPFDPFARQREPAAQTTPWQTWFQATNWDAIEGDLVRRLDTGDRDVIRRTAVTLGHVGGAAARAALRAYVTRQREDNPYPEWMKTHRGDGARFNAASPANPRALQAATRALGDLQDVDSVPLLAETIARNSDPATANLFLAEAAAEALGRIGTPRAEEALIHAMAGLKDYFYFTGWYGDHGALYACHASPVHYLIVEALDAIGSTRAGPIIPHLIRSVPTDPDRALLLGNDDCETLVGRVIRRCGAEAAVVETCLAMLGDDRALPNSDVRQAISTTYQAWGGKPDPENRAAHILSLVCRDRRYEPRIRAALDRYRVRPAGDFVRAFAGGGLPRSLPVKHWVCFFLARSLGNLADPRSLDALLAVLKECPKEAASGRPDPSDAAVLFLHNELTPCYRAAAAWALGRIGQRRAVPALLGVIEDLDNAIDTRYTAAEALQQIHDPASLGAIRRLAADYPEISTRKALLRACAEHGP
jgi:HEAT repeat protein